MINSNLSLNTDYTLITRYAPSNGLGTLWLNPSSEADPSVTAADTPPVTPVGTFALRQSLSGGDGMGSLFFDTLLVGTSFSDVYVPAIPAPPRIVTQPSNQTVTAGSNATFTVTATGTAPLAYQWQFYGTNLIGETNPSLFLTAVTASQAGPYAVTITNSLGTTNSQTATLTVDPAIPPTITAQPQSQMVNDGDDAMFTVSASGTLPLSYQWRFNGTNLIGATNSTLALTRVTPSRTGPYFVVVTNFGGATNSETAVLTVNPSPNVISILTYNVNGNGSTNWSTNAPQVQAVGHQLMYLQPDIVTFNEIPRTNTAQMTNWIKAFLPGYSLATNSGTDGFIRSVIASRFPITRSQSWLDGASLTNFGYNGHFARDLFEAQISVPGFPQPLHVFTTHLKATIFPPQEDADQRAAEATAISNFFVTVFLTTNSSHPNVLTGDLNEDVFRPDTNDYTSGQPIQRLTSPPTGLLLTTPLNPITLADFTESIRGPLNVRFDYVLPSSLLFSNILSSQVFRTDLLTDPPPPLQTNDDKTASDHLPVLMVFSNPYNKPFSLTSITRTNQNVTLRWDSVLGQPYRVEASSNLATWFVFSTNITATGTSAGFSTNVPDALKFFRVSRLP